MSRLAACALILLTCAVCTRCASHNNSQELIPKEDDELSRGMKSKMTQMLPFVMAPALAMAGIMPWILPGIQMAVMFVTMMNNMAFSSALFMLIRNYIFNTQQDEHIVYINHGYKNKKKHRR